MKQKEIREIFQKGVLPEIFINYPGVFYEAFNNGTDAVNALFKDIWADICKQNGENPISHPFEIKTDYIVMDESEENFTCLLIMQLPELKKVQNLAIYVGVFFGINQDLRLFLGEAGYDTPVNRHIFVVEIKAEDGQVLRKPHQVLYQGCNNEPMIFPPVDNPKEPEPTYGLEQEEEWQTFTDVVAKLCVNIPSF